VHGPGSQIYDWAEWWPEELFKNFEKEFGVKVTRDHFADTEEMVTKIKLNPKVPYDLVTGSGPTDAVRFMPGYPILTPMSWINIKIWILIPETIFRS
jgi:hypothetical protein